MANASSDAAAARANAIDPRLAGGGAEVSGAGAFTGRVELLAAEVVDVECDACKLIAGGAEYWDNNAATPLGNDDRAPPPAGDTPVDLNGNFRFGMLVTRL